MHTFVFKTSNDAMLVGTPVVVVVPNNLDAHNTFDFTS